MIIGLVHVEPRQRIVHDFDRFEQRALNPEVFHHEPHLPRFGLLFAPVADPPERVFPAVRDFRRRNFVRDCDVHGFVNALLTEPLGGRFVKTFQCRAELEVVVPGIQPVCRLRPRIQLIRSRLELPVFFPKLRLLLFEHLHLGRNIGNCTLANCLAADDRFRPIVDVFFLRTNCRINAGE